MLQAMNDCSFDAFAKLVRRTRSVRRFAEEQRLDERLLTKLIDLARLSPCSANRQTLRFLPCCERQLVERIFPHLAWAGYLADWHGPQPGERPAAYIVVLHDKRLGPAREVDAGIALQSMLLGAYARGLAGCIIGSIKRGQLAAELGLAEHLHILYLLALGQGAEQVVVEELPVGGEVRYWRDAQGVHHVPKRTLAELLVTSKDDEP